MSPLFAPPTVNRAEGNTSGHSRSSGRHKGGQKGEVRAFLDLLDETTTPLGESEPWAKRRDVGLFRDDRGACRLLSVQVGRPFS